MEQAVAGNELAARMELCRKCLVLRGPFFDSHNGCERVQRCGCEPRDPLWNAFDYNCAAELCRCCASRIIPCGSIWSVFFCEACKPHVVAYNGAAGWGVIPIGRHSMMNGVALKTEDARKGSARRAFARGLSELVDGIGRLERFHRTQVTRMASSIDGPGSGVPVPQYIDRATRSEPSASAAFAALVLGMGVETAGTWGSL
jgi:hypothetical protein